MVEELTITTEVPTRVVAEAEREAAAANTSVDDQIADRLRIRWE